MHPRKFSHLTQKVQRALNSGIDRVNADTAMEQASVEGGLAATTMVKLTPGPRPTSKEGTSIKHTEWCVIRNAHETRAKNETAVSGIFAFLVLGFWDINATTARTIASSNLEFVSDSITPC